MATIGVAGAGSKVMLLMNIVLREIARTNKGCPLTCFRWYALLSSCHSLIFSDVRFIISARHFCSSWQWRPYFQIPTGSGSTEIGTVHTSCMNKCGRPQLLTCTLLTIADLYQASDAFVFAGSRGTIIRRCARMALNWQVSGAVEYRHSRSVARSLRACDLVACVELAINNHPIADVKAR